MADIVSQPWFWPAVIVSVGLPLLLIGLTEFHNSLARRGSRAAPIILMVRNYLVPVAGILVLITQPGRLAGSGHVAEGRRDDLRPARDRGASSTRSTTSSSTAARRGRGATASRRSSATSSASSSSSSASRRCSGGCGMPTSPASSPRSASPRSSSASRCRTSVGSIVSGLFLIFEAPFELGDWIETGGMRGQIVEVNWRADPPRHRQRHRRHADRRARRGLVHEPLARARPVRGDGRSSRSAPTTRRGGCASCSSQVARDIPLVSPDREPTRDSRSPARSTRSRFRCATPATTTPCSTRS